MARPGSPARIGGAGFDPDLAALLTVDVDLGPLERGLAEGQRRTRTALGDMGRSADTFSRSSQFAFQNAAFQVTDFVVQVSSGQGALRAFAQQAPQLLGAFGPVGAILGLVAAAAGGAAIAFTGAGRTAAESATDMKKLDDALTDLAAQYKTAEDRARDFIGVAREGAEVETLVDTVERIKDAQREFGESLAEVHSIILREGLPQEAEIQLRNLVFQFSEGEIDAAQFNSEMQDLARTISQDFADALLVATHEAATTGAEVLRLRQRFNDLATGVDPDKIEKLRQKIAELRDEAVIGQLPKAMRDLAEATKDLGISLTAEELAGLPQVLRDELITAAALITQNRERKESEQKVEAAVKKRADAEKKLVEDMRARLAAAGQNLQVASRIAQATGFETAAGQVRTGARFAPPIPEFKPLGDAPTQAVSQFERINASLDEQAQIKLRIKELQNEINSALQGQLISEEEAAELNAKIEDAVSGRAGRIESGGRLPDDIDAANIAAAELATTLTELDDLSFASLGEAFASIGQQLAQMVLQALIFRAIMGGVGGGAGLFGGLFGGGPVPTAQHGAVFRRGHMALMTGAISGAALLEGAGDEAAVPLVPTRSGHLGVRVEGSGGRQGDTYNLVAQRIDPGTVSWLLNTARQQVPNTVVNARARGQVRDKAPF